MDQNNTTSPPTEPNEIEQAKAVEAQQLRDYLGEKPEKPAPKEEVKVDAPKEEAPAAPQDVTKEQTPPFDPQKFEESITQKVTESIVKAFTGKTEQNLQQEGVIPSWQKEGREKPRDYQELANYIAEINHAKDMQAQQEVKAQQEAAQKQEEEVKEQQKVAQKQFEDETNANWDSQWKDLEAKFPELKSKDVRRNFWQQINDFNVDRHSNKVPLVDNLVQFHALYYKPFNPQPAGTDAPIAGANTNIPKGQQGDDYDYRTIHNARSLAELLPKR